MSSSAELEARTIYVRPGFDAVLHAIFDPRSGRFGECITERPDLICSCGAALVVWAPRRRDTCLSWELAL